MRVKLTPEEQARKDQGLCIVPDCPKSHGEGLNICYDHKNQRHQNSKAGADPVEVAYEQYKKSQLRQELPAIPLSEFRTLHVTAG